MSIGAADRTGETLPIRLKEGTSFLVRIRLSPPAGDRPQIPDSGVEDFDGDRDAKIEDLGEGRVAGTRCLRVWHHDEPTLAQDSLDGCGNRLPWAHLLGQIETENVRMMPVGKRRNLATGVDNQRQVAPRAIVGDRVARGDVVVIGETDGTQPTGKRGVCQALG